MDNPILSLCIPTNGAIKWVIPVIDSIYEQGCDKSLFEVIITDNAKNHELQEAVESYEYGNIHYYQSDAQGFLNIVSSFKSAKGDFCKLINHRSKMKEGSLHDILVLIDKYKEEQPVIYCTNGVIGDGKEEIFCKNLDELVQNLHYYCTWMAGIGIWRKDVKNLDNVEFNKLFPNTTILFEQRVAPSVYLLYNKKYFNEQNGQGKGCYNLFYAFAVEFPGMLNNLLQKERITKDTFGNVLKDLYICLQDFYMNYVLLNQDNSFDLTGIHKSFTTYYSEKDYWRMKFYCYKQYGYQKIVESIMSLKVFLLGR